MKKLNYLLMLFLLGIVITSCQRDELIELIPDKEYHKNDRETNQINLRSFNQVDCGFNDAFCEKRDNRVLAHHEPVGPCQWPCFTGGGSDGSSSSKIILPVEIFDGTTAVYYDDGVEKYFIINSTHRAFLGKTIERKVSNDIIQLLTINYRDITDGAKVLEDVQSSNLVSLTTLDDGKFRINSNNEGGTTSALIRLCDYYRTSDVDLFITTFFDENVDFGEVVDLISEAYDAASNDSECSISGYTGTSYSKCRYNCIDPRCIVDHIFNSFTDENTKKAIIARYVASTIKLTDEEASWLENDADYANVLHIYNGLGSDLSIGRCDKEDCGLAGGYHELIKQQMTGESLTSDDTKSLLEFFSVLSCDNPEIYGCFREAQQNPNGAVALFLNQVKAITQNNTNALVNGCDDLSPYVDRWNELALFDPISVPEVKDKLEELGEEYWIQTIDNATNVNWWWEASPTVNMDFFGINITEFPNKPYPPFDQFIPEEFFDYIQDNFATASFMGDGNDCHSVIPPSGGEFVPYSGVESFNWTGETPITSTFEINMFDDGSVICTDFNEGENWTFSTLNAPGWLEGDSYDGFHPVSGNRQFGIIQNPDGSYTFYTSGVDRLTGFWHVLGGAGTNIAFDKAEELWKCFLDQLKIFVEGNGGAVSDDYDCTNVRPDLDSLQELLMQGCGGDVPSIAEFPCHQSTECP